MALLEKGYNMLLSYHGFASKGRWYAPSLSWHWCSGEIICSSFIMALLIRWYNTLLSYQGIASKGEIICSYPIIALLSLTFPILSSMKLVRVKSREREFGESETRHCYQGEIICSFTIMALVIRGDICSSIMVLLGMWIQYFPLVLWQTAYSYLLLFLKRWVKHLTAISDSK